jgi:hypothetical protein
MPSFFHLITNNMHKNLLFANITNVPVEKIQELTAEAMDIDLQMMFLPDRSPGARKREYVTMRQISMTLSKDFTKLSLASIGTKHGHRDHATTLHAVRTVKNLLDIKDREMVRSYKNALQLIKDWNAQRSGEFFKSTLKQLIRDRKNLQYHLNDINRKINNMLNERITGKSDLVKFFIRNHVPLFVRQQRLKDYAINNKGN